MAYMVPEGTYPCYCLFITNIVNKSILHEKVPACLNELILIPLSKKSGLNLECLKQCSLPTKPFMTLNQHPNVYKTKFLELWRGKEGSFLALLHPSVAFDTVDHESLSRLIQTRLVILGTALTWFRSYLADLTQNVMINDDTLSTPVHLPFSTPQVSVLRTSSFLHIYLTEVKASKHN